MAEEKYVKPAQGNMERARAAWDRSKRKNPSNSVKSKFFLGNKLYGRLYTDRTKNIVIAWCSTDRKRVVLSYHDFLNSSERPYSTRQVARMLNRTYYSFGQIMRAGDIVVPERWHGPNETREEYMLPYMWRKEDILDAHTVLLTKHNGRPNKWGEKRAIPMVSRPELLALLRNDVTMYIKDSEGNMLPTWRAVI
jgi:hypothetical protein